MASGFPDVVLPDLRRVEEVETEATLDALDDGCLASLNHQDGALGTCAPLPDLRGARKGWKMGGHTHERGTTRRNLAWDISGPIRSWIAFASLNASMAFPERGRN
jgi:hypothetical protein